MLTLKAMVESQIRQATDMINHEKSVLEEVKSKMDINKMDEIYFENKAIEVTKHESISYWKGVLVLSKIVLDYIESQIRIEEQERDSILSEINI